MFVPITAQLRMPSPYHSVCRPLIIRFIIHKTPILAADSTKIVASNIMGWMKVGKHFLFKYFFNKILALSETLFSLSFWKSKKNGCSWSEFKITNMVIINAQLLIDFYLFSTNTSWFQCIYQYFWGHKSGCSSFNKLCFVRK